MLNVKCYTCSGRHLFALCTCSLGIHLSNPLQCQAILATMCTHITCKIRYPVAQICTSATTSDTAHNLRFSSDVQQTMPLGHCSRIGYYTRLRHQWAWYITIRYALANYIRVQKYILLYFPNPGWNNTTLGSARH